MTQAPEVSELLARSNRLGSDPRNTNYAGGNTSAKGHGHRPGDRRAGRAAVGQGVRRRPRHADRGRAGRAPAGPAPRPGRRLPGGGPRGRDGRRVRLLPARQGGRGPVHRHRHARPGGRPARGPPAPGLGDRARHRGRRRGADPGLLRRPGAVGAVAAARLPARPGHRRGGAGQPGRDRRDPRRPRHHRVGRDQRRVRGALAGDHRDRAAVHRRARRGRARSARCSPATSRCPRPSGAPRAAALAPLLRGLASHRPPQVGHFTDRPEVLDFLAREKHPALAALGTSCPDHFLRTKVRPMVLDLPPSAPLEEVAARLRELHAAYREDYRAYYERHADAGLAADARRGPGDRAGARRRHVQLRRGQADRAGGGRVLRQRDQRDARRRGGLRLPPDPGEREVPHRVLGAGRGQAAAPAQAQAAGRPGGAGHRGRLRHRPGHRAAAGRRGRLRGGRRPGRRRPRRRSREASSARADVGASRSPRTSPTRTAVAGRVTGRRRWRSAGSTWWSTTPGCRSPSRCWRPAWTTGTSSTT